MKQNKTYYRPLLFLTSRPQSPFSPYEQLRMAVVWGAMVVVVTDCLHSSKLDMLWVINKVMWLLTWPEFQHADTCTYLWHPWKRVWFCSGSGNSNPYLYLGIPMTHYHGFTRTHVMPYRSSCTTRSPSTSLDFARRILSWLHCWQVVIIQYVNLTTVLLHICPDFFT